MPISRFEVVARPDPQTLARLVNFFAQRGLVPRSVRATENGGLLRVMIEQHGLALHEAGIVADKMRTSWLVEEVRLRWGRRYQLPLSETVGDQVA